MKLFTDHTLARLVACLALGAVAGLLIGFGAQLVLSILVSWGVAAALFVIWTFAICWPMSGDETRAHAGREDASRGLSEIICIVASLASMAGVVLLLAGSHSSDEGKLQAALIAVGVVVSSWLLVHTTYTLRYAGMYYDDDVDAHIDFNEKDGYVPCYSDFYYLGFDMGTTYQVSDTNVSGYKLRRHITAHGMLSYVFATAILATVVNTVTNLVG